MIKWIRPSGTTIETKDDKASIEHALKAGWKREGEKQEPKKRGPKPKKKD